MMVGRKLVTPVRGICAATRQIDGWVCREVIAERAVELEIDEAGRQEQPVRIERLRIGRRGDLMPAADLGDAIPLDDDRRVLDLRFRRQQRCAVDGQRHE